MSISNSVSDLYRLNRDILASIRLNFQHYIWKESLGYLLHPSIKLSSPTISIADIGTGTGIWLTDPCRQYPNAQLHGFDISDDQYPASGFLESNVSLRYLDILKEIPAEYVEKYDVVHARLLVQVVNQAGGDPVPVIRNLMKLVKPGGYLQWEEPNDDAGNRPLVKSDPSVVSEKSEEFMQALDARFRAKTPSWSTNLAPALKAQGLENVIRDEFQPNKYILPLDQMNYLALFGELISRLQGEMKETFSTLLGQAGAESRNGVAWKTTRYCFVGQKV